MNKIYVFCKKNGQVPFFLLYEKLDRKLQQKIIQELRCLALFPKYRTEPHVKHFTLERYAHLYEYRERIRVLLRVIYTLDASGNIILLVPLKKAGSGHAESA